MKVISPKRSKLKPADAARQAVREARKASRGFAPGEAELDFIGPDGAEYYRLNAVHIPGYTYAF